MSEFLPPEPIDGGTPQQPPPQKSLVLPLVLVLSGVIIGSGYLYLKTTYPALFSDPLQRIYETIVPYNRRAVSDATEESTPKIALPSRSPYPLFPDDGTAGTFKVSQGKHDGPTFNEVRIDPLDAKIEQDLSISITLTSPTNISSVAGTLYTDTGKISIVFQRVSRNNNIEKWKSNFKLTQSVLYTYKLNLVANDGNSTSNISMAPRN